MIYQKTRRVLLWSVFGLVIIAATALGAKEWLSVPTPQISTANEELAVAQRVCDKANKISEGLTNDPPFVAIDCIEPNRECEKRWGQHSVWAGASDGSNTPICSCDQGFMWRNNDGTLGTSYGTNETFSFISAPGRCIKQ